MRKIALLLCLSLAAPSYAGFFCRNIFKTWLAHEIALQGPSFTQTELPVAVIGAGPGGLSALNSLTKAGIAAVGFERNRRVGGVWDNQRSGSPAYDSLETNSSISTQHLGDPWPAGTPDFVNRESALQYLIDFSNRHELTPKIQFETEVLSIEKTSQGTWKVQFSSPKGVGTREFRAVVVASGVHHKSMAVLPKGLWDEGSAAGLKVLHSVDYRNNEPFKGLRVLVVGIGNSGAEIATEISQVAQKTLIAVRRTPWIVPLRVLGKPADEVGRAGPELPHAFEMFVFGFLQRITVGSPASLGFEKPDHDLLGRLPVTDRGFAQSIREGKIQIRSTVSSLENGVAHFTSSAQTPEPIDAVVFATGYRQAFPFLPPEYGNVADPGFTLPFLIFHPTEPGLVFLNETVVPQSSWSIFIDQSNAMAAYFQAETTNPERAREFNLRRQNPNPNFKGSLFSATSDPLHVNPRHYSGPLKNLSEWFREGAGPL